MNAPSELALRLITQDEYDFRRTVGRGRVIGEQAVSHHDGRDRADLPIARLVLRADLDAASHIHSTDTTAIESMYGNCELDDGREVLGLLAGVPLPPESNVRLGALFDRICISRLDLTFFSAVGPAKFASASHSTSALPLVLFAERASLSAFARARAPWTFWKALLRDSVKWDRPFPDGHEQWKTETPLILGRARLSMADLAELAAGDVVQIGMGPDASGRVDVANLRLQFNFHFEQDHVLVQLAAVPASDDPSTSFTTSRLTMNTFDEFDDSADDRTADDDNPSRPDIPTEEEAIASKDFTPDDRHPTLDVGSLEMEVVAEIGRLTLTVAELSEIAEGSVVKVAMPGVRTVALRVATGGTDGLRTIAAGELVQVGDTLAIQVLRVFE